MDNVIDILAGAQYIESKMNGRAADGMRLQKLLYYSHAWSLAWTGKPLFGEGPFEAWRDGPVARKVYDAWGRHEIQDAAEPQDVDTEALSIMDAVIAFYGHMTGDELSALTHSEGPWIDARGDLGARVGSTRPIYDSRIRAFYVAQSLDGAPAPARQGQGSAAEDDVIAQITASATSRWREALDELATR